MYPGSVVSVRASNAAGLLSFNYNQGVQLACPGRNNYLRVKGSGRQEATAYCVGGTVFSIDGIQYQFNQLTCQQVYDMQIYCFIFFVNFFFSF